MDPLTTVLTLTAAYGCFALFTVALVERAILILPSSVLFISLGTGAAAGHWSLASALSLSIAGSLVGSLAFYWVGAAVSGARSKTLLVRLGQLLRQPPTLIERLERRLQSNATTFAFAMQLVPTVRLLAPAVSGLLRAQATSFTAANGAGIALWNSVFITVGYAMALLTDNVNATVTVAIAVTSLGGAQIMLLMIVRRGARSRGDT